MNIRDLRYLVAVAEYQHFGKAAKACFVSQPALSMQLQKLEDSLGVTLFERTNKTVRITDVGRDIVARARRVIAEVDAIKTAAESYQDPFSGTVTLGAFPTLAPYLFPIIIPHITEAYTDLTLLLMEEKTDILIDQLHSGTIDAALLAHPILDESLQSVTLLEDPFLLAVSPKHPLAKRTSIQRDDLKNEPLLLLEDGHCLRDQALEVCTLVGSLERQDFRATSLETLRHMVAANSGITLIPKIAHNTHDGLIYLPFSDTEPSRTIALVWRKTSPKIHCLRHIAQTIKECL